MPIKAHVKGKRKAPLPPILQLPSPPPPSSSSMLLPHGKLEATTSNVQSSINQSENKFPNGKTGKTPETMTCFTTHQKRKKPAPLPPSAANHTATALRINKEKHATDTKMNNLSAISKRKVADKSAVKAINLNIFEPNHIRNHLQCTAKETNEVNVNMDLNRRRNDRFNNDFFTRQQQNDQIWICSYCTLQNPFWKIICDACERIKPYNTPTIMPNIQMSFGRNVDNDPGRPNGKNLMSTVMMRPKPNNDGDKILNRNSMNVDIKSASSSKQLPNKRNSLCLFKYGDQNISPEALEIEKERIRAVIRAMNNRALAQKLPEKTPKENRIYDDNDNDDVKNGAAVTKVATINKPTIRRNGLLKYDIEKDYNLPSVRKNVSVECTTTMANDLHTNANNEPKPIKKIDNTDNVVMCTEIVENTQTYCDEKFRAPTNTRKFDTNEKRKNDTASTKNSIKTGIENNIR